MVMKFCSLIFILPCLYFLACTQQTSNAEETGNAKILISGKTGSLKWSAPESWVKETPKSSMRKAQYSLSRVKGDPEDATVVIYYFKGQGGGVEANIKRWAGQFTQPDGRQSEDIISVRKDTVNDLKQTIVDVSGTFQFKMTPAQSSSTEKPNFRMIAAVVESGSGPWFVKFVGPHRTIDKWQDSFYNFMKTFKE